MRWIYLSPHLDDAIFSMGGLMYEQVRTGKTVEVWTIHCGLLEKDEVSPFARKIHTAWGFNSVKEVILSRREENRRAAEILGAKDIYLDFLDCIYRQAQDRKWLYETNTFVLPHEADNVLVERLTSTLSARLEPSDEVVCPLAIGGHIDHVLTRRAAENLKHPLWYYTDIPYLFSEPLALDLIKDTMQSKKQQISWRGLVAWQNSAAAYTSQIPMEFENQRRMRFAIAKYWWKKVLLWHKK